MHVARAYGAPAGPKTKPLAAQRVGDAPSTQPNIIGRIAPKATVRKTSNLVAARVNQPIDFHRTAMPSTPSPSDALQLYTRAADRIEAAIGVELGRRVDVRG